MAIGGRSSAVLGSGDEVVRIIWEGKVKGEGRKEVGIFA